jgi:hypothetical protein
MDTHIRVENPEKVTFTLTLTLTLKEWEQLVSQLDSSKHTHWPASHVIDCIMDMTDKAKKAFYPTSNTKEMRPDNLDHSGPHGL